MPQDSTSLTFTRVAKAEEIVPGSPKKVDVGDLSIAVFNLNGEFYAIDEICSHAYASLLEGFIVDDDQIECPLHGACFSIKTGKALTEPATVDLATYPVRVENGDVFVGVPQ